MIKKGMMILLLASLSVACDPQSNCETECGELCGSGICGETGTSIGKFFGRFWDAVLGNCSEICTAKLKFVNENGQSHSGVCGERIGLNMSIRLTNGNVVNVINSNNIAVNSSGESSSLSITCISIGDIAGAVPVLGGGGFVSFTAQDPTCPPIGPGCRDFGMAFGGTLELDFDKANCEVVIRIKTAAIGPCIGCC